MIIVQKRQTRIDSKTGTRREERKVVEVSEVVSNGEFKLNKLFEYDYKKGVLKKCGKSIRVADKIMETYSLKEKEMNKMLKQRESILKKLKGKVNFREFFEIAEKE